MKTKKILVVDEEETILKTISKCLQKEGFEVMPADNYISAIQQLETTHPDLIITDMVKEQPGLPNIIDYLRQNPGTAALPVILLTGMDSENLSGAHTKASLLIEKPFDMDVVVSKVKQLAG